MAGIIKRKISKVVVANFLEATMATLDHLAQWHMKDTGSHEEVSEDLTSTYGSVRRIRDYLQKCMSAYSDTVDWEMTVDDDNLLVACAAHALREIDAQLIAKDSEMTPQQEKWLREKQRVLVNWAVQLATHTVADLPAPKTGTLHSAAVQELQTKVGIKLGHSTVKDVGLVKPFTEGSGDVSGIPLNSLVGDAGIGDVEIGDVEIGDVASSGAPQNSQPLSEMLNVRAVQDPRLRALLAVDLAALRNATEAQDNRLSLVHLSSILEGLVTDYILPRRKELGFSGTPDGWNLKEFLLTRFSDRLSAGDRGILHHVFNSHNLLRPIAQYMAPMVVTPSTVQQHMEFVREVAQELGYAGASPSDASETPGSGYRDAVVPKRPMD